MILSAVDYILLTKNLCESVYSVHMDESGIFDLHSDHVILNVRVRGILQER